MQEFEVQSMSCGGCASRVAQAVKNLDAQAKIEVDLQSKRVRVETTKSRADVAAALTEAGYAPNLALHAAPDQPVNPDQLPV